MSAIRLANGQLLCCDWPVRTSWERWVAGLTGGLLVALWLAGCATEPVTGRKQLMLVSGAEETQLGLTA